MVLFEVEDSCSRILELCQDSFLRDEILCEQLWQDDHAFSALAIELLVTSRHFNVMLFYLTNYRVNSLLLEVRSHGYELRKLFLEAQVMRFFRPTPEKAAQLNFSGPEFVFAKFWEVLKQTSGK